MSEIALLTWDGGGNVAVTLAIALALRARGHTATVVGPRSLRRAVVPLAVGYAELGILPPRDPQQRLGYLLDVIQARMRCSNSCTGSPSEPTRLSSIAT